MAALEHEVEGRRRQARRHQITGLSLIDGEELLQAPRIGGLEVVGALALLKRQPDVAVAAHPVPVEIPDALHILQIHGQALKAVGDLDRHRPAVDAAALLEIGELGHLHAIEPHLPAHPPGAEGGGFPVVLHEADVVVGLADTQGLKGSQVGLLDAIGAGLDQHLVLKIVLGPVRVVAIAAVGGAAAGLGVGHSPGLRPDRPQHRVGAHRASPLLRVVGLKDQAALLGPEAIEGGDDVLEVHGRRSDLTTLVSGPNQSPHLPPTWPGEAIKTLAKQREL